MAVVVDHLTGWPGGGFVGVDVFFVISGFLISGLLLREHERTGHISFIGFYRRRIKRILPAAVLVLAVTVVAAKFVFLDDRWRNTVTDSIWAFLFSANWRFESESVNYFAQGSTSPLQHYWSLSIEEQFYFVWPWLMLLVFTVLLRNRSHQFGRTVVFGVIAVITASSFVWAVVQTSTSPAPAYFSTFTRIWELGVGAMLAVAIPWVRKVPDVVRVPMAWIGFIAMIASLWIVTGDKGFPAPAAALPVLATALVIAAGTRAEGGQQRFMWPLTNRGAGYLGDVSYSMYLWHFPIIILLGAYMGANGRAYYAIAVALIIVATVGSYHLVEEPLRHSPFLDRHRSRAARRNAVRAWWDDWGEIYTVSGTTLLIICFAGVTAAAVTPPKAPTFAASVNFAALEATTPDEGDSGQDPAELELETNMNAALKATSWPSNLEPSLDNFATDRTEEGPLCGHFDPANPLECAFGDPKNPTMAVLGDSTGSPMLVTLRAAYGDDYYIRGINLAGCPVLVDDVFETQALADQCHQHRTDSIKAIQQIRPDVLFVITAFGVVDELGSGAEGAAAIEEWRTAQAALLAQIGSSVKHIILISSAPRGPDLTTCATKTSQPSDCEYKVPKSYPEVAAANASFDGGNVHSYDTVNWFCNVRGDCPPFVGNIMLKRDLVHTTQQWSQAIAPIFKANVDPWISETAKKKAS